MPAPDLNYFTCTLGQAVQHNEEATNRLPPFTSVIDLVDTQAQELPQSLALGFANFSNYDIKSKCCITFLELSLRSKSASVDLESLLETSGITGATGGTVGLLCTSSIDFVLTWLGLLRLGFSVIFLAPQLEPTAIRHVCKTLQAQIILVDKRQRPRAADLEDEIIVLNIPSYDFRSDSESRLPGRTLDLSNIAYYCHTSGTSSGLPKPIPQSHYGVVGILPRLNNDNQVATFTTTPLYHGGTVDCLRAWSSGAGAWAFPEGVIPITGSNLCKSIEFARSQSGVPVKYYSSVPYVLQMLAETVEGVSLLQTMDLVGIGGAALSKNIGDNIVKAKVKLLSRMGSAECGFLMSSHREYDTDEEWQYLRPIEDSNFLMFEPRGDGLFELVVKSKWPFKIKATSEDGSYATSDLFEPHLSIKNAWRYHSRGDAQITLANGKKFDPAPLEGAILTATGLLRDVLIIGSGKDFPGAILFPVTNEHTGENLIEIIWPSVDKLNKDTQSHARIGRSALKVIFVTSETNALEKSSKGTVMRRQAEERYEKEIAELYAVKSDSKVTEPISNEELQSTVTTIFSRVLGRQVDNHKDLYQQGVDSISCIQIRKLIEKSCIPQEISPLPLNVIYDQGSVTELIEYLRKVRKGEKLQETEEVTSQNQMRDQVKKYSDFFSITNGSYMKRGTVVVLTGATGLLGTHILHLLRQNTAIQKVYCLLRASTPAVAHERVSNSLIERGMTGLEEDKLENRKILCLASNLTASGLDLDKQYLDDITERATLIIHCAWAVNFTLPLKSFEDQLLGTYRLITLALKANARFVFVSSIAAVSNSKNEDFDEKASKDPADTSSLGYSQSKWVAEQMCITAAQHIANHHTPDSSTSISIIRVGQLCGNTKGIWNKTEAYPLILSTASITGCLPNLPTEILNWLPVDVAAQSVIDIAIVEEKSKADVGFYHVLNRHTSPSWTQMLEWITENASITISITSQHEWIERLEQNLQDLRTPHPSQALLGLWKDSLGQNLTSPKPVFGTSQAEGVSEALLKFKPLGKEQIIKMWRWVEASVGK